ncbi:unnamed protein product [Medioppia subpectinata]|uniref:Gamma-interferon-inducible lysosomal thiol reductase n=1 Tax=Medioppia subpectinata TaxID=1979941 RepID=A0A7R9Q0F8_9ACAR|nr:unnamed protein product [Medioppia subpectinata]CAG2107511.1 unnamed protein product [Medioppia subpectinata]
MTMMFYTVCLITIIGMGAVIADTTGAAAPVKIDVYYEALCPYSKQFIVEQLIPTYNKVASIITVGLIPFGNAKWKKVAKPDGTFDVEFTCQHGEQECIGNRIHDCVLLDEPIDKTLAFQDCIFKSADWKTPAKAGKPCAEQLKLNWTSIDECSTGPLGRGLLLLNGERHVALKPQAKGVPWIVANGVHTDDIQERAQGDLLKYVCDTYTGPKPSGCK